MTAKRMYDSRRWRTCRRLHLERNPFCALCQAMGKVTVAKVVDHKVPHRGDPVLFWDEGNFQSLCKACHDSTKQRLEKSGVLQGADSDGIPLDPSHPWNQ